MGTNEQDLQSAIVAQLQAERGAARLTYAELAEKAELKEQTVMRYLTNKRDMPMSAFLDLCTALEMDPRDIVTLAKERKARK